MQLKNANISSPFWAKWICPIHRALRKKKFITILVRQISVALLDVIWVVESEIQQWHSGIVIIGRLMPDTPGLTLIWIPAPSVSIFTFGF